MISYLKHSGQVGRLLSARSSTLEPSSVRSKSPKFSIRSIFEKWQKYHVEKNMTYNNKFHHPQISTSINKLEVDGWKIKTNQISCFLLDLKWGPSFLHLPLRPTLTIWTMQFNEVYEPTVSSVAQAVRSGNVDQVPGYIWSWADQGSSFLLSLIEMTIAWFGVLMRFAKSSGTDF